MHAWRWVESQAASASEAGWKDALGDLPTATLPPDLGLLQRPCLARLGIPTSSRACPYSEITSLQVRPYWSVEGLIQCDPFPPKKKTPCDEADAQCPVQGHRCRPRSAEDCELEARTRRERRPQGPAGSTVPPVPGFRTPASRRESEFLLFDSPGPWRFV